MRSSRLSIIIPLYDKRVSEESCLESWCERQSFARDQYEVIVTSNGADPEAESRVRAALGPHDRLVCAPGANMAELYHVGACSACSPLLLFTELHCIAKDNCLDELMKFLDAHNYDGACLHNEGGCPNTFAAVECELFKEFFDTWSQPDDWRKVQLRGFAVRRDVYFDAGGIDARYNRFAEWILAAQLHDRGYKLGYVRAASVVHYYCASYGKFFLSVKQQVIDECEYRAAHSPSFCHRYFGTHPDWSQREIFRPALAHDAAGVFLKSLLSSGSSSLKRRVSLSTVRELVRLLAIALFGLHLDLAVGKLRMWLAGIQCWRWKNDAQWLRTAYLNAYKRIEDYYRLRFIRELLKLPRNPIPRQTDHRIDEIFDDQFVAFYQQEEWQEKLFRWTRGVGLMLLNVPRGSYRLRIDTNELRGCPLDYVTGLYFNGHRIPNSSLCAVKGSIFAELDKDRFVAGNQQQLAITCIPLKTKTDKRLLGIPVFRVSFRETSTCAEVAHETRRDLATPLRAARVAESVVAKI